MSYVLKQYYDDVNSVEIIEVKISIDIFDRHFNKVLDNFQKKFSYPGFRRGHVPKPIILAYKHDDIHNEALVNSVNELLHQIVQQIKPEPISSFFIKSYSQDEDLSYRVILSYIPMPEVVLPDFSSITVTKVQHKKPTEDEIIDEIKNIWYLHMLKSNPEIRKDEFDINSLTPEFLKSLKLMMPDQSIVDNIEKLKEFAKQNLEKSYKNLAELENEKLLKEQILRETKYYKLDGIVNHELEIRKRNYLANASKRNLNFSENSIRELEDKWRKEIEYEIKFELLVRKYSLEYNISVSDDEISEEIVGVDDLKNDENNLRNFIYWYRLRKKVLQDVLARVKVLEN